MKFIAIISLIILVSSCKEKQEVFTQKDPAVFLIPSKIDLGKIEDMNIKELNFEIVNKSDSDMKIVSKAKSCGCTNFALPSDIIKARSRMKIKVDFDPSQVSGDFEKSVFMRLENGKILMFKFLGKTIKS